MKKLIAALALVTAAYAAPTLAGDVGVSISIGQPGFYGQLDFGNYNYGRPQVIYGQPVIVQRGYRYGAPIYLRVPPGHANNWRKHCGRYNACGRPVYFVRDDWYRNQYAPRYRQYHSRDHRNDRGHDHNYAYDRRDDRGTDRYDDRRDDRDDHRDNNYGRNYRR